MMAGGPLLELAGVTAGYGHTVILEDLDLVIDHGARLSILGRNGVGKSTLIDTIMGHTTLHAGAIRLDGREIGAWPPYRRNRAGIGYVPQEREIFPSLTVYENLAVAARPGPWTIERVLATFPSLKERRHQPGRALSGGEQQMLAIARALVGNPRLLLMDEPSEGLAPIIVRQLAQIVADLGRDEAIAVVLVEQHVQFALDFADRCLVMERGRIVYDGVSRALASDPERLQELLGVTG